MKTVSFSGLSISRSCNIPAQSYLATLLLDFFLALLFCSRCLLLREPWIILRIQVCHFPATALPHLALIFLCLLLLGGLGGLLCRRFLETIIYNFRLSDLTAPPYLGSAISRLHRIPTYFCLLLLPFQSVLSLWSLRKIGRFSSPIEREALVDL